MPEVLVPFYISSVACGEGVPFCDGIEYKEVCCKQLKGIKEPLIVEVTGNSMEPYFYHKDLVIVDMGREPRHNDFVLFLLNGILMMKRLHFKNGIFCLISTNFLYPSIFVKEYDNWEVLGVCVKKVSNKSDECKDCKDIEEI